MKNIADVNSDDILSQLNNLDYDVDDDLKLLDDEDIRPINNTKEDDLSDFYKNYNRVEEKKEVKEDVDLYTEKTKVIEPINPAFEEKTIRIDPPKPQPKPVESIVNTVPSIDTYLNRKKAEAAEAKKVVEAPKKVEQPTMAAPVIPTYPDKKPVVNTTYNKPSTPVTSSYNKSTDVSNINDINQLFNKVSSNVRGASEIVNRNAEIKKKIEAKFEELRKMQEEHEYNKKRDYEEINAYKDEVYTKLQQKKADMERDLTALRTNQEKFEKEKKSFEEYKNSSLSNLNKLEKELKDSYENRNKNIEQVEIGLVRRKEQLDIERANIAKEREQVQKEKDELAKNLVQFNKLVSEFTQGIDDFG